MESSHDVFVASPLLLAPTSSPPSPPPPRRSLPLSIHTSESQQEFFRMLDEKIEKVRRTPAHHCVLRLMAKEPLKVD